MTATTINKIFDVKNNDFDKEIIIKMHEAKSKEELNKVYYKFIELCVDNNRSMTYAIEKILNNKEQNTKFSIETGTFYLYYPEYKLSKVMANTKSEEKKIEIIKSEDKKVDTTKSAEEDKTSNGIKYSEKLSNKITNKINYVNNLISKIEKNQSKDPAADLEKIRSITAGVKQTILSVDPETCTEQNIEELNTATANIDKINQKIKDFSDNAEVKLSSTAEQKTEQPVVSTAAARTEGAFDINNFIKKNPEQKVNPASFILPGYNSPAQQQSNVVPTVFPHQICKLSDDEIKAKLDKHFRVFNMIPMYPLYDLISNKTLAREMKKLGAEQSLDNLVLTQVNINEYIDIPEVLAQYPLCFTVPCKDKAQLIIVLFNPNPVPNEKGILNYPMKIFKARKTKPNNK